MNGATRRSGSRARSLWHQHTACVPRARQGEMCSGDVSNRWLSLLFPKGLAEFCEDARAMPIEPCWLAYIQQFDLAYTPLTVGDMKGRFLERAPSSIQSPLSRFGFLEEVTLNPVFVLHIREPSYIIQFSARVVDEGRIRRIMWQQILNRTPGITENQKIDEDTRHLNAFAPAGERWLASETYAPSSELNMRAFLIKCKPGSHDNNLLRQIGKDDFKLFGKYMTMAQLGI